jgi:hypothetical protein
MKRPTIALGTAVDVAAELRLHGLRVGVASRTIGAETFDVLTLRNTPVGDVEAWVRPDPAHFFDSLGYPDPLVPVADTDLWEAAAPHPRLLFVASKVTRAMLVCVPRRTYTSWVRRDVTGPRGYMSAMTCPREQTKSLSWLKNHLL